VGESLIDEVTAGDGDPQPHVGGSPLNVAVGLARLGLPVQFLTRHGADTYGRMVDNHLRANAVLAPLGADGQPTSVAAARLDSSGAARYEFNLHWELPGMDERLGALLDGTTMVHTGSIAAMLMPGADDVLAAVRAAHPHATVSYDPNCRPTIIQDVGYARERAEQFVALADVVKASDEDLEWLYPGRDVRDSATEWLGLGPSMVLVTRGARGPWGIARSGQTQVPAPAVHVADTVGAGDSFMAAVLARLVELELDGARGRARLRQITVDQLEGVLAYAARAAAITVSRAGANPPARDELGGFP
jgi:fructokinase